MADDAQTILDLVDASDKSPAKKARYKAYVEALVASGVPPILSFTHLADLLGVDPGDLHGMAFQTQLYYKTFFIPKRSGGQRQIIAPHAKLDLIQRWIGEQILAPSIGDFLDCVVGYRPGKSILDHVKPHLASDCLVKFDLKDFFPSIKSHFVAEVFARIGYGRSISKTLAALLSYHGSIPQGASTSPMISNIFLCDFDSYVQKYCEEKGFTYTRYVDDIVISGDKSLAADVREIKQIFALHKLSLNHKKTRIYPNPKQVRFVTGLLLKEQMIRLPKAMRRKIRAQCHLFLKDIDSLNADKFPRAAAMPEASWRDRDLVLDPLFAERILGKLNYWLHVEPGNGYAQSMRHAINSRLAQIDI